MKRTVLSGLAALSLAAASLATASPLTGSAACQGEVFNPINDPNWNNMFPVTVAGISMGGGRGGTHSRLHVDLGRGASARGV